MVRFGVVCVFGASCLLAQTVKTLEPKMVIRMADGPDVGPVGITTMLAAPIGTVTGAPYSAQVTTQRIQVLADGNHINQSSTGSVARDSQGRIRRDEALPSLEGDKGSSPHVIMIDDPVAQVHWNLDAQSKTAVKLTLPSGAGPLVGAGPPPPPPPPPLGPNRNVFYSTAGPGTPGVFFNKQIITKEGPSSQDPNVKKSDLGTQIVEGVSAQGTKYTRTIPAGQVGNEQPITITTETWYSPELKVLVMSKSDDPRMGETIYKLTDIQRAEPAMTLFQPPDDYTVKESPQDHLIFRDKR